MNRDIGLGIVCSLLFHASLLWVGPHIQRDSIGLGSLPAVLDLSIVTTYPYREDPGREIFEEKARQGVPSPTLIPIRSRPVFAKIRHMASENVLEERVKAAQQAVKASEVTRKAPFSERIPAPRPIWNARVIVKQMNLSRQSSERRKIPLATPDQVSMPVDAVPSYGISRVIDRVGNNRRLPPTEDEENKVASILQRFGESTKPSNKDGGGPRIAHEAYVPDRGDTQITEAIPDYAVNPKPVYPRLAILRGHEGTVTLLVEVLPDGSVGEVEIFESSGHASLDRSALKAVRKWRFKPGTKIGKPLTMKVKVPVVFRLKRDDSG